MRILAILLIFCPKVWASSINFIANDLSTARLKARQSQRLIVVKFYANWCTPCKTMDEYVWTSPDLIDYVEANYVAAKVDIDNFDGLSYKQHYEIVRLPTILLLDACGNEVVRLENYLNAERMINWLQMFNNEDLRVCHEGQATALPETFFKPQQEVETDGHPIRWEVKEKFMGLIGHPTETPAPPPKKAMVVAPNIQVARPNVRQTLNASNKPTSYASTPAMPKPIYTSTHAASGAVTRPKPTHLSVTPVTGSVATTTSFYQVERENSLSGGGFGVQIFASSTPEGAEKMKNQCLARLALPVMVLNPLQYEGNLYRVVVGPFSQRKDAEQWKHLHSRYFQGAFVRSLSR